MDSSLQYICGSIAAAITGAVATAAVYIATRPPPKIKRNFDLNAQSEELPVRTLSLFSLNTNFLNVYSLRLL